jgi:hypothetical protein
LRLAVHCCFDSHESKSPAHPGMDTGMNRACPTMYQVSAGEGASPEQCARCTLRKFGGGQGCGKEPRLFRGRRQSLWGEPGLHRMGSLGLGISANARRWAFWAVVAIRGFGSASSLVKTTRLFVTHPSQ